MRTTLTCSFARRLQPERIQGDQYSVKSDVWSLGITIIELALGRFPFAEEDEEEAGDDDDDEDDDDDDDDSDDDDDDHLRETLSPTKPNGAAGGAQGSTSNLSATATAAGTKPSRQRRKKPGVSLAGGAGQMSMLELLQRIVNEPPPRLPIASSDLTSSADQTNSNTSRSRRSRRRPRGFPPDLVRFVDLCVTKDPSLRPTPKELASGVGTVGEYVKRCEEKRQSGETDLKAWVDTLR